LDPRAAKVEQACEGGARGGGACGVHAGSCVVGDTTRRLAPEQRLDHALVQAFGGPLALVVQRGRVVGEVLHGVPRIEHDKSADQLARDSVDEPWRTVGHHDVLRSHALAVVTAGRQHADVG